MRMAGVDGAGERRSPELCCLFPHPSTAHFLASWLLKMLSNTDLAAYLFGWISRALTCAVQTSHLEADSSLFSRARHLVGRMFRIPKHQANLNV